MKQYFEGVCATTVILAPGVGNPGSVPHRMLRFRWIRLIRFRVPRGSFLLKNVRYFYNFAGIGDLFLALSLKKPKENQCFWLRTLKNLRKINVFALPEHLVTLGAPLGPPRPKNIYHKLPIHRPSGRYVIFGEPSWDGKSSKHRSKKASKE